MSRISDYTDDTTLTNDFKQNFDLVSPEEIQYYSESLLHDFEELNRKAFIFGLPIPRRMVDLRKWMKDNLHPQLQMSEQEPSFFHEILVIRKVIQNNKFPQSLWKVVQCELQTVVPRSINLNFICLMSLFLSSRLKMCG